MFFGRDDAPRMKLIDRVKVFQGKLSSVDPALLQKGEDTVQKRALREMVLNGFRDIRYDDSLCGFPMTLVAPGTLQR